MKIHPNTPDFWLDYKGNTVLLLGRSLRPKEIERVMHHYINDKSIEQCVLELNRRAML